MFELTNPCEGGREIMKSWLAHFERVNRPAGIVMNSLGQLSIWRAGERRTDNGVNTKFITDEPVGTLIHAVHGFEAEWPKKNVALQLEKNKTQEG